MSTLDWFLGKQVVIQTPGFVSEGVRKTSKGTIRAVWREPNGLGGFTSTVTVVADDGVIYERQLGGDECKVVVDATVNKDDLGDLLYDISQFLRRLSLPRSEGFDELRSVQAELMKRLG